MAKQILFNPGPVVLSQRVRNAMLGPDICHKEPEFIRLQNKIRRDLLDLYQLPASRWAGILMTASGTAAVEAMMTSFVPAHGKVMIIENGAYGERLSKIAGIHNIDHLSVHHQWGADLDLSQIEGELQYHREITHVALVHHETTTGRLNDLRAIAELCRRFNASILLDGVSSFGAEAIRFKEWNVAACAAAAGKCIHGAPGISFVIANRRALAAMAGTSARTLYLDLGNYLRTQDAEGVPFTQSVHAFYALSEALDELKQAGGWQNRNKDYWRKMNSVRDGFERLGIRPLMERQKCSCVVNAFHLPQRLSYTTLHDRLKQHGLVIYTRQRGPLPPLFRIACMGDLAEQDIDRLIAVMATLVKEIKPG